MLRKLLRAPVSQHFDDRHRCPSAWTGLVGWLVGWLVGLFIVKM